MAYLTKDQVRQIVMNRPAGTTPEGVVAALRESHQLEGYPDSTAPALSTPGSNAGPSNPLSISEGRRKFASTLPSAGAAILGTAGNILAPGAGGFYGATFGGMAGKAGERAILGQDFDPNAVALEGGKQAVLDVAGAGLGKVVGWAGKNMARRAFNLGMDETKATSMAMSKRIRFTKGGLDKAESIREESAKKVMGLLRKAQLSGWKGDTGKIVREVTDYLNDPSVPDEMKPPIRKSLQNFYKQYGRRIDPVLLKGIKQTRQELAQPIYLQGERGRIPITKGDQFSADIASGAKRELEKIPGVGPAEAETQAALLLARQIKELRMRPPDQIEIGKPLTWPLLNNRAAQSVVASELGSRWLREALRQTPRASEALRAYLAARRDATGTQ